MQKIDSVCGGGEDIERLEITNQDKYKTGNRQKLKQIAGQNMGLFMYYNIDSQSRLKIKIKMKVVRLLSLLQRMIDPNIFNVYGDCMEVKQRL